MNTKSKIITLIVLITVAVGAGLFAAGCSKSVDKNVDATQSKTLYTCGMHPQIIQDHPGNCPICGMKLTPIRKQSGTSPAATQPGERKIAYYKSTMNPGETSPQPGKDSMGMDMVPVYENAANESPTIAIDPATIQTMNIRTARVARGPLRYVIRTVANVDYDETALADVTTKYKGWIEKLYVDATGALVNPGDPLFEIYSPELYSAQTEYLAALAGESGTPSAEDRALLDSARTKLKFYDISDAQIAELEKTRKATKTLTISAPIAGFVVEKNIVQGQMVDAGMKLYRLADIGVVWVYAQVYEQDLPAIRLGQEATMTLSYLPDRKFRGRVTYVYPDGGRKDAHGAGAHGVPQSRLFSQARHVRDGGAGGGPRAVGVAGAGRGGAAQRREKHHLRRTARREIRGAHRDPGTAGAGRHGPVLGGLSEGERWSHPASSCSIRKASCARRSRK
jgi:Cu(I)/Ag(I) efflux system membrane fusion protein